MATITPPRLNRRHRRISVAMLAVVALAAWAGRAQAVVNIFSDGLTGAQEVPPNPSTGLGLISGTYDDVTNSFDFTLLFTGLMSPTTQAHLHSPAPVGVNAPVVIGFVGFPVGVTTGSYSNTYTFTAAQETHLLNELMYVNVHTSAFPGGEIRGQITRVPEPGMLSALCIAGLAALTRRSRSS